MDPKNPSDKHFHQFHVMERMIRDLSNDFNRVRIILEYLHDNFKLSDQAETKNQERWTEWVKLQQHSSLSGS